MTQPRKSRTTTEGKPEKRTPARAGKSENGSRRDFDKLITYIIRLVGIALAIYAVVIQGGTKPGSLLIACAMMAGSVGLELVLKIYRGGGG